jgi:hypothetical protein
MILIKVIDERQENAKNLIQEVPRIRRRSPSSSPPGEF